MDDKNSLSYRAYQAALEAGVLQTEAPTNPSPLLSALTRLRDRFAGSAEGSSGRKAGSYTEGRHDAWNEALEAVEGELERVEKEQAK